MKTFISCMGGIAAVAAFVAFLYGMAVNPESVGMAIVMLCSVAVILFLFYLGFTFTRDVLLGGR